MPVVTLADAETFQIPGFTGRPLAVPSRGSTQLAIWSLEVEPGGSGQPHTVDKEEVFVLHEGHLSATVDGQAYELAPGDALIVPPDVLFSLRNVGRRPARLTVCTSAGVLATLNGETIAPPWAQ